MQGKVWDKPPRNLFKNPGEKLVKLKKLVKFGQSNLIFGQKQGNLWEKPKNFQNVEFKLTLNLAGIQREAKPFGILKEMVKTFEKENSGTKYVLVLLLSDYV